VLATPARARPSTAEKLQQIRSVLAEFDRLYLTIDPHTGREVYPEWLLPSVQEINAKLAKYTARLERQPHSLQQEQDENEDEADSKQHGACFSNLS